MRTIDPDDPFSREGRSAMSRFNRMLSALVVACLASPALARVPTPLPEPDSLSLLGVAVVAGIVAWRIRNRK